jgi:hypothetical protein
VQLASHPLSLLVVCIVVVAAVVILVLLFLVIIVLLLLNYGLNGQQPKFSLFNMFVQESYLYANKKLGLQVFRVNGTTTHGNDKLDSTVSK